ncbi:MAG: hypothetical protein JRN15_20350 [Nitrososphaerota archaeon]|nr:hypothetical protein [Nitrososphaerota archaeon]
MKLLLKDPMIVFARVKGKNGRVRELSALLDYNSHFSWMLRKDAVDVGYPEAINRPEDYEAVAARRTPHIISGRGLELGILVKIDEVSIGNLVAKNVDAITLKLDFPMMLPIDLILGRNFLENFTLTVNSKEGYLLLE